MDVKDHPVITVLGESRCYMVPIYQRQYAWGDNLIKQFWDDVAAKANEIMLKEKPKFQHYMGALILAPGTNAVGRTPTVQVVDGQQRLTTFQLFIASLRSAALDAGFEEMAAALQSYIFNVPKAGEKEKDAKFKLTPTPADRDLFRSLISDNWNDVRTKYPQSFYRNGNLIKGQAPKAMKAVAKFRMLIDQFVNFGVIDSEDQDEVAEFADDEKVRQQRFTALQDALLLYLKLVVIQLGEDDDAQVIFETLNSKAEPLLAMDLVRNNIFHRAEAQGESVQELFDEKWIVFENEGFWKADAPRAKPRRPRIDHFLSHALTAQTGRETSLREVYAEYRNFARPRGNPRFATVAAELDALTQFAPTYKILERPDNTDLGWLGEKLSIWEVAVVYPAVFLVATAKIDEEDKRIIYRLIYSYIVRRAVCSLTPKNYNNNFERLTAVFIDKGVSIEAFKDFFAEAKAYTIRFPTNEEFSKSIINSQIYRNMGRKERIADMLWELELVMRTKFQVQGGRPAGLSVEHVMPQGWRSYWHLPSGQTAPAWGTVVTDPKLIDEISVREALIDTLGNLTLVTKPLNSQLSNGPWSQKKQGLEDALLALNTNLTKYDEWNNESIVERAQSLKDKALNIWPGIDGHVPKEKIAQPH